MIVIGAVLAVAAAILVFAGRVSSVRAGGPLQVPDREGYFDRWTALHGGHEPRTNPWLRGWLTLAYTVARPLARRGIHPSVLTLWSTWAAGAAFLPAVAGGYWLMLAGWLLVLSGLGDTLDGCVAALTDRASRGGAVLDAVVDRVNDVVYLCVVVLVGGPVWLAVACGTIFFIHEYARTKAATVTGDTVGAVTVGERANRVILLAASVHFGGVFIAYPEIVATAGLAAMFGFAVLGLAQLVRALRSQLAAAPAPSSSEAAPPPAEGVTQGQ
jgi:CDP-diacylglycerol--glycerol-3-phosphate 3-phosphatidyltransferase